MIVGDFGLGRGYHRDQGGLAHIGEAYQAYIRQQLELQGDLIFLAGQAGLGKPGDLPGRGGKMAVAPAAAASLCQHYRLQGGHIRHDASGIGVLDDSAQRHLDDDVLAVPSEAVLAGAGLTIFCGILGLVLEVDEGGEVLVHLEHHIAALAAVTAIGAAGCHILLPVEMHRTIAALTGTDLDFTDIYKHVCCPSIGLWGAKNELPVKKPARFPGVYTENRAKNCCHSLPHLPRAGLHQLQVFSFADAN